VGNLVQAYLTYASAAQFGVVLPTPVLLAKKTAIVSAFVTALNANTQTGFIDAWLQTVQLAWAATPLLGPGASGVTVPPSGGATLRVGLLGMANGHPKTVAEAAQRLATLLHAATLTTTATVVVPPAGGVLTPIA
jgi:hypothetical protein